MSELWTLKQLAQKLNINPSTCSYYRDSFEKYIPFVGEGRKRRYPKDQALPVFEVIVAGFKNNQTSEQIENRLAELFPVTQKEELTTTRGEEYFSPAKQMNLVTSLLALNLQTLQQVAASLEELKDSQNNQQQQISNLQEQITQQHEHLNKQHEWAVIKLDKIEENQKGLWAKIRSKFSPNKNNNNTTTKL